MADTGTPAATPNNETISEESLLLDHVRRIERTRSGCCAVHFRLSELQAPHRQPKFIRIAARAFDTLINNHDATLYALSNADMALVCRNVRVDDIDVAAFKLRSLFAEDPLTWGEHGAPEDRFATWYDLAESTDYATFEDLAVRLEEGQRRAQQRGRAGAPPAAKTPLDAGNLAVIAGRLQGLRIADLIRQQPTVDVRPGQGRRLLFREHYVNMAELTQRVAPDVDLAASPWLFQYLTEILDRRVLAVAGRMDHVDLEVPISLNLNVSTVMSPEFQVFHDHMRQHTDKVVIEIQMIDVFSDMAAFDYARKRLRDQGYRVLIDGLYPLTMQYFDPGVLDPDFVKIHWSPYLAGGLPDSQMAELKDVVEYTGRDKIILARVEIEDAVKWGLTLGIHCFQGYFVDRLVDAMIAKGLV